jgi:hypothetical protein
MAIVPLKETKLVVAVDDLDFRIRDVAFEAKGLNGMAPLIELQIHHKLTLSRFDNGNRAKLVISQVFFFCTQISCF